MHWSHTKESRRSGADLADHLLAPAAMEIAIRQCARVVNARSTPVSEVGVRSLSVVRNRGLADGLVGVSGRTELPVGGVFDGEQSVVSFWQRSQNLIKF